MGFIEIKIIYVEHVFDFEYFVVTVDTCEYDCVQDPAGIIAPAIVATAVSTGWLWCIAR
jgi:hypothetical protein